MLHKGIYTCSYGEVTAFGLHNQYEESRITKLEIDLHCRLQSNENEYPHYFTWECSS